MNLEILDDSNLENSKIFFRKMRNDIVGSMENKMEYIKNNHFNSVLNFYVELKENNDIEYLRLIISIINSFVLTHSSDIKLILPNYSALTQKTIKIILLNSEMRLIDRNFYECCFRLLKSLAMNNLFSMEKCFNSGFISSMDEFLINDICYQYISIIMEKICESSYYKHQVYINEKLIDKLIKKFFETKNKQLIPFLLGVITSLTDENQMICKRIYDLHLMDIIPSYIRFYDNNIKILSINLMMNVLQNSGVNFSNESLVIYSNSILLNLIKEETISNKIRCTKILSVITKKYQELQNIFYNLDGIETLLKELKNLYSEEKLKGIEESVKNMKTNKSKKTEKVFAIEKDEEGSLNHSLSEYSAGSSLDEVSEYKRCIFECLASASSLKEDSRKQIIESKELNIILASLEENNSKILQSAANLILSLSRAHLSVKKYLHEYDITSQLFKLTNHPNVEIQIAITNSLCNFLLDYSSNMTEIIDCVSKLLKILSTTKHNKIRLNSIFSIKNILFYISSNVSATNIKEIKKAIMKKFTYDNLLSLLDDEDVNIQEQALLIFRVLLFKTPEDIEEVFNACKAKLFKKIEEKLNSSSSNSDIILQLLYILCNISTGSEKQKSVVLDKIFLKKLAGYLDGEIYNGSSGGVSNNLSSSGLTSTPGLATLYQIKSVTVLILNNLLSVGGNFDRYSESTLEKKVAIMKEFHIFKKLEKISHDEDEEFETKQIANNIINQIKNIKS